MITKPSGIEVLYREPPTDEVPPPALAALVDVLVDLRILPARSVTICGGNSIAGYPIGGGDQACIC